MTAPQAAPTTSATSACPTGMKDLTEARRATAAAPRVMFLTRASKAFCLTRADIRRRRRRRRRPQRADSRRRPQRADSRRRPQRIGLVRGTFMRLMTDVTVIVERTTLTVTSRVPPSMDVIPGSSAHPWAHARSINIRLTACPARNGNTTVARNLMMAA